ncbi:LysR family transcriptional regulator [Hydrogenophaga sp.]|uniref:LysR family transcriptional regulator n=1 Tax=Hydrogenophaga sp. TaxID=1904254 RepID=UPI003F6EE54E
MINLRHVEVFYAVMRTGSVTHAARLLNVTQPAVSVTLRQFETRLKLRLFERTAGRLVATPEARRLMPHVGEIFGRLDAIERMSQDLAHGVLGSFSVAATPPLCDGLVVNCVAQFARKRPHVSVGIQATVSSTVVDRVISGEVDLGVVFEPVVSAAIDVEELAMATIGCVMPSKHRLARKRSIEMSDLIGERLITYLPHALLRPYIDHLLGDLKGALQFQVLCGHSSTAIALATEGAGLALIESTLFRARSHPGFVLKPLKPTMNLKILLLRPIRAARSNVIEDFVQMLRERSTQA